MNFTADCGETEQAGGGLPAVLTTQEEARLAVILMDPFADFAPHSAGSECHEFCDVSSELHRRATEADARIALAAAKAAAPNEEDSDGLH